MSIDWKRLEKDIEDYSLTIEDNVSLFVEYLQGCIAESPTPADDMVRMMEVLGKIEPAGYEIDLQWNGGRFNKYYCRIEGDEIIGIGSSEDGYSIAFTAALDDLLASLDPQPSEELKKKLGMQYCPKLTGDISSCDDKDAETGAGCAINGCPDYVDGREDYEDPRVNERDE